MDWLFATAVFAATLPVYDGDFACFDAKKAESYVRNFNINLASFGGLELCDNRADTKKLFNDLLLVEQGQIADPPANTFIQDFVPKHQYFDWLKRQTYGIDRGNDMPYAIAYNSGGYFTMQDGWAKLSTLGRVGTVIHEARHTEGHYHRPCTHGPYQGTRVSGCDHNVFEGGSHGIEMEYYARVYLAGTNFHPVYKDMARLMLLGRANFVFNERALQQADELLVRTEDKLIRLKANQRQELVWAQPLPANLMMKRTSFGSALVDLSTPTSWAVRSDDRGHASILEDEYSYYKLLQFVPPAPLIDLEEVDQGVKRFMLALTSNGEVYSYLFAEGQWSSPQTHRGATRFLTLSPDGEPGLYLKFGETRYCRFDPATLTCASEAKPWPENTKAFFRYQAKTLRLDNAGKVETLDGQAVLDITSQPVLEALEIPVYDAFGAI